MEPLLLLIKHTILHMGVGDMGNLFTYEQYMEITQNSIQTLYCYGDFELSRVSKDGEKSYYLIEKLSNEIPIADKDIFYKINRAEFYMLAKSFNSKTMPIIVENY